MQHAKRMRHIILPSVAPFAVPCFSTLHKRHDFRKDVSGHKMCVMIFCTTCVSNISNSTKHSARYQSRGSWVKYLLFLSDLNETRIFSTDFLEIFKCQILCSLSSGSRVVPCGRTDDRRADKTNVIVAYRDFAKSP